MLDRVEEKFNVWARSRYILGARLVMRRLGVKRVRWVVLECPLEGDLPRISSDLPVSIELISVEDVISGRFDGEKLASSDVGTSHEVALERLKAGDMCFAALVGSRVAGYAWVFTGTRKYESEIETELTFEEDECLGYDARVLPEFRGNRILQMLVVEQVRRMRSTKYARICGCIEADNVPSLKSARAIGMKQKGLITCFRVFKFKRVSEELVA